MGDSARIALMFLIISAATAVPMGEKRSSHDDTKDLNAESSEIISEAVAPPDSMNVHEEDNAAAADQTDHSIELLGRPQTFFPSFANLFENRQNNYRFGFGNEGAFSQRPNSYRSLLNYPLFGNYKNNFESFSKANAPAQSAPLVDASSSVLGSGNFGIIKGGTFFAQNDEDDYNDGFSYYNNGHGRPSTSVGYIANPRPDYNQDQFANFRDFADINAPSNAAYSHFVVVYANKNGTMDEISEETRNVESKPKNIFEALERLDKTTAQPKISKSKAKLALTKQKMMNKKDQWKKKNSKFQSQKHDAEEPLLALS